MPTNRKLAIMALSSGLFLIASGIALLVADRELYGTVDMNHDNDDVIERKYNHYDRFFLGFAIPALLIGYVLVLEAYSFLTSLTSREHLRIEPSPPLVTELVAVVAAPASTTDPTDHPTEADPLLSPVVLGAPSNSR
jgi:hypothetical protein